MPSSPRSRDARRAEGDPTADALDRARALIESARFDRAETELIGLLDGDLEGQAALEANYMLAVARRYRGDHPGALRAADRLLASQPEYGRGWQEKGYSLLALNQPEESAGAFARAVDLNPGLLASWKSLVHLHQRSDRGKRAEHARAQVAYLESLPAALRHVIDLIHEGRLFKAEQLCRQFLRAHPHHVEGMRLLADIGVRLKIYDDAEFLLESCVEFEPDNLRARVDYLRILNRKSKFSAALGQAEFLSSRQPDNPVYQLARASALTGLGRLEEGIALYRQCLEGTGNKPGIHVLLGHAQKAVGALDDAVASYREAYRLKPDYGDAFWSLANTKTYTFSDDEVDHIRRYESADGVARDDRIHLCFAAGKALEDRQAYAESFQYYQRGNALKRGRSGYDPEKTRQMVQAQIQVCSRELFEQRGELGHPARDPIFIVGLPRAGSTLLEQILASHSRVDGTMELHNILGLAQRLRGRSAVDEARYPQNLWELDGPYFRRFGERFIDDTRVYRGKAPRFIDKMPNNFMHIGLIRLILPNAKIIDARRDPMACCFSGFKQLFGEGQDFSYDLGHIGHYYRDYVALMDHWDQVLPGFVLRVRHEDVVADLETQVRRMLEFCELPFEQNCLEFHRTRRNIRTPSSEQVRQPIYTSGLEQWRHYEPFLEPLREALGPLAQG